MTSAVRPGSSTPWLRGVRASSMPAAEPDGRRTAHRRRAHGLRCRPRRILISVAEEDFPSGEWHTGDLADFDFAGAGITEIDVAFCAGNVLSFLDPASRRQTLGNIKSTLKHGGSFRAGFGAGRGYDSRFHRRRQSHGMFVDQKFSTLGTPPFEADSDFIVLFAERLRAARMDVGAYDDELLARSTMMTIRRS